MNKIFQNGGEFITYKASHMVGTGVTTFVQYYTA